MSADVRWKEKLAVAVDDIIQLHIAQEIEYPNRERELPIINNRLNTDHAFSE